MPETMAGPLVGRRVLIVEDRYLIASEMADQVARLGAEVVGPSPSVSHARELLSTGAIDLALLDVDLDGEAVFPVAALLAAKRVPFVFLTGYDDKVLPEPWRDCPRLAKPVHARDLRAELLKVALTPSS